MKAQQVNSLFQVSEIQVSYLPKFKANERPKVSTAKQAYEVLINNWDMARIHMQEQMYMLLLNTAGRVIGISLISTGGKAGTLADPKIIFSIALKAQAASIIVAHNHPSENLTPSQADLHLTRRLVEAGKVLDLLVVDHLIVTANHFYSFDDEGLI
jgi:DNA repair protein RadC